MRPDATGTWSLPDPYDFAETTRLLRTGGRDPTLRREPDGLWRTAHTVDGPATVHLRVCDFDLEADAWGPGAACVMDQVPRWVGLHEDRWRFPSHPIVDRLAREHAGLRGTDTGDVFEAVVNAVLQQLVTWNEAAMTWRRLCEGLGDAAPGPVALRLSPTPTALRRAGLSRLQAFGIGGKRARTLIDVARVAHALPKVRRMPTPRAAAFLQRVPGIGPWTADMVLGMRLGRPEPVPRGDFHLPNTVAWGLAREPRGSEARMRQLLAPFDGQGFRVVRLLFAARIEAPRRGPKRAWRRV